MNRKVLSNIHTEKITNEPFDDIIGHSDTERKYFTVANNDIIYKRLKSEIDISALPYLGPCVDFGLGDVCLEESIIDGKENFKFYVIDRATKFNYREMDNVLDAIKMLVEYYDKYDMVSDYKKMEDIFLETLNLKNKVLSLNKKY